ncbi:MAG: ATP-binding protein, partial [Verrucomicrobia bacterium]
LVDRESAYEKLQERAGQKARITGTPVAEPGASVPAGAKEGFFKQVIGEIGSIFQPTVGPRGGVRDSVATSMAKSAARAASSQVGRQVVRGLLGGILGGRRR